MSEDDAIIDGILEAEGGFVDHPSDRGSVTNRGVTLSTLSGWLKRQATVEELRALSEPEARAIYRALYIEQPGFGAIDHPGLRALVVDCGVNHGVGAAIKLLQRALMVPDDGHFGIVTHAALAAQEPREVYLRLCAERIRLYGRIITGDAKQAVFASGWMNRAAKFIEAIA